MDKEEKKASEANKQPQSIPICLEVDERVLVFPGVDFQL